MKNQDSLHHYRIAYHQTIYHPNHFQLYPVLRHTVKTVKNNSNFQINMQIDHTFDIQYLYVLYFSDRKA